MRDTDIARTAPSMAWSRTRAARELDVCVDFFDQHIAPELRSIRRGRRKMYPVREIHAWMERESQRAVYPSRAASPTVLAS